MERKLLTITEACARYNTSRSQLYKEMGSGRLRAKKNGDRTLIDIEDADRWAAALPNYAISTEAKAGAA